MNNLIVRESAIKDIKTIEEGLDELSKYGNPRLSRTDAGNWYCAIEMFVNGEGVQFQIASDYKHSLPIDAIRICLDRLNQTLKSLAK